MADKRIRDEVEKLRKQLRTQRKGFEKRLSERLAYWDGLRAEKNG